jgi:glycosyltransferase involved in cell wall biosynthesis
MDSARGPLVSVVIPVYNCAAFVSDAIAGVLEQSYGQIECVVVDDGSTDATSTILRGFGSRIKYFRQPRRNGAAARNVGARIARGEFLAFLDADDMWQPTKLARQMELALARPELGLVYCSIEIVDELGRHIHFARAPDPGVVSRNTLLNEPPWLGLNQTGLVPRWAFDAVGGYDDRLTRCEDGDLTWRLAVQFPLAVVPEPLAKYRLHPAQAHRDVPRLMDEWEFVLDKAFASGLLPPDLQALERQARANLALDLAYEELKVRPLRSAARICEAARLSPTRVAAWALGLGRGRVRRFWRERQSVRT